MSATDRCTSITGIKLARVAPALLISASLLLAACAGGGGGSSSGSGPVVAPTPTPTPTATPTPSSQATANPAAFVCPSSGAPNSTVRVASNASFSDASTRYSPKSGTRTVTPSGVTVLAVSYNRATAASNVRLIAGREIALGANLVQTYDYPKQNVALRLVSVPTAKLAQVESGLRAQSGIQAIGVAGERRFHATSSAYVTNDPYFDGFSPSVAPYHETSSVPGQWDMYAIGLPGAYGYSKTGNTVSATANALGSGSIKIAVIDTGVDASHPELASKIYSQNCFITNEAGTAQSTGAFSTDEDGHGTDVSGIAAAATNNSFGFTGAGGNSKIMAYRVFPTPDDNCANPNSTDVQCSSSTADIASAINYAVTNGANVITMSLGGGGCTNGVDSDATEQAAITNALSHNVIVVAASGNNGPTPSVLTAPACDTGVIAVGATSLADGQPTGTTGNYTSNAAMAATALSNPVEYVASYSQSGTPGAQFRSSSAWGIVAPGGDPANAETLQSGTPDDLHWIENIWTTTPYGGAGDTNFAGACTSDYGTSGPIDCRTLIAGTSMATPHVAGAVALILAVNPTYQNPTAMKQLLCTTADELNDTREGCGRLNVYRAMATALGDPSPP